ncbi:hypothetical protein [Anaeromicropila herbilytica]|uniref:Uncharacterized protein n=1 Tax=Anaeromicropila herbilytica TaxID=2785025 RepID=A0A7R7ENB6_9FIRM|nr:hypothetical protein [Anaeromicropila herbilytica]BCN31919.1 hypothetical protein bsdtb5_32140 [Anaeromicropila herbilytica]
MNEKRKTIWIIFLSVITTVILCITAYKLGVYTTRNANTKDSAKGIGTSNNIETPVDSNDTSNGNVNKESGNSNTATTTSNPSKISDNTAQASPNTTQVKTNIIYSNTKYGFDFTLPASWEGYSVLTEDWQGTAISGDDTGKVVESGKEIILRHPRWTKADPYQDIPIMVFSLKQWNQVVKEEIALGAAPIGPSKLGSNSKYVFALPARYNFAYPTGYEEVEKIMESNPLSTNDNFK